MISITVPEGIEATIDAARDRFDAREYTHTIALADVAIARMEATDRYDARMVDPYILIGDAALELGDYSRAIDAYQNGVQLQRMTQGLLTSAQIPLVYRQAEIHVTLGDLASANYLFEYAYQIMVRANVPIAELTAAAFRLGRWYERMGFPLSARMLYERLQDDVAASGETAPSFEIELLVRLARTYRLVRFPLRERPIDDDTVLPRPFGVHLPDSVFARRDLNPTRGGRGLKLLGEARGLATTHYGEDSREVLALELEMADWMLLYGDLRRARERYAWVFAAAEGDADVRSVLSNPSVLSAVSPGNPKKLFGSPGDADGSVSYLISFDEVGLPRELATVAKDPEDLDDIRFRRHISHMRFRPPLKDGQLVEGVWRQTYEFTY